MAISPYLKALRERIGSDLVLLPSVCALIWDADGRLLLMREAQTKRWQTVGGMVDPDESPHDAVRREAREETGYEVRVVRLRAAVGGPEYRLTYPNGDRCAYVSTVYDVEIVGGDHDPDPDEVHELGWFDPALVSELDLDALNRQLLRDVGVIA